VPLPSYPEINERRQQLAVDRRPQVDTRIEYLCCSGTCESCTCISGAWPDATGRTLYSGSCEGTCGGGEAAIPFKSSYLDVETGNGCMDSKDPLNCIDCKATEEDGCNINNEYSVRYGCSQGQSMCCTVSNIDEPSFGDEFGVCQKDEGIGMHFKAS